MGVREDASEGVRGTACVARCVARPFDGSDPTLIGPPKPLFCLSFRYGMARMVGFVSKYLFSLE